MKSSRPTTLLHPPIWTTATSQPRRQRRWAGQPYAELKDEYANLWAEMAIRRDKLPEVDAIVQRLVGHKDSYRAVGQLTKVPWFAIAIVHNLAGGRRLHQAFAHWRPAHRAHRACAGRAAKFWQSAVHVAGKRCRCAGAMTGSPRSRIVDRTPGLLFEDFNGFGYRLYHPHVSRHTCGAYSNHYTSGKYVGDGQWSETAVSRQCGAIISSNGFRRQAKSGSIAPRRTAFGNAAAGLDGNDFGRADAGLDADDVGALTQASIPMTSDGLAQASIPIMRDALALATAGEKVLPYDHSIVPQETGYWCGPAATQVVLNSRGIYIAESGPGALDRHPHGRHGLRRPNRARPGQAGAAGGVHVGLHAERSADFGAARAALERPGPRHRRWLGR